MVGIEVLLLIPFTLNYRLFDKEQRLIYLYLICRVVQGVGADLIARIWKNNLGFHAIMSLIGFIILSFYFIKVIKKPFTQKIILWMMPVASALFLLDITVLEGYDSYNSIFVAFRTFLLIAYGILFFMQLIRDESLIERSIYITSLPSFWFNSGLFVNLCCNFLLDLSFNFLLHSPRGPEIIALYQITAGLTWLTGIIQAILFYIGLLKLKGARS